jgi:F-type H+-transporting ATPase subunit delta
VTAEDTTVSGVSGRYATALFELAVEEKSIDTIAADLDAIDRMIEESTDLKRLVMSPVFSAEEQTRALAAILDKAGIAGTTANFIRVVAANRRLFVLQGMIAAFRKLVAAHRGEVSAEVTSAEELTEAQVESLAAALKASIGKDVRLSRKVDPGLLGGLIVKVGSRMIDTSLRTKLNNLKIAMKEVG